MLRNGRHSGISLPLEGEMETIFVVEGKLFMVN